MFEDSSSAPAASSEADAIPDGAPKELTISQAGERVAVLDLIGIELPPPGIATMLFDSYLKNIHRFQLLINEATFRIEFDKLIYSGTIQPRRMSFLMLTLAILAMGCVTVSDRDVRELSPCLDRRQLQKKLVQKLDERFLEMFDEGDIEAIQAGTILCTYYGFYEALPRRAYVVLGACLKSAMAQGLHKESTWGDIPPMTRELRRRAWWALYTSEV